MELLLGCGSARDKRLVVEGRREWTEMVTLDHNADHRPDVAFDLERLGAGGRLPFEDDTFQEIHAYEVLEHIGRQGDWRAFFDQFSEFYRVLKPGGHFAATVPSYRSMWAFGDPSHTRVITSGTLVFLDQEQYKIQVGKTAMSDFRFCWRGDFQAVYANMLGEEDGSGFSFVLRAVKPSRWEAQK